MAVWADYNLTNVDVDLVVTVRWRATQAGPIVHTDMWRYNLTDRFVVGMGANVLADRIVTEVRARAHAIEVAIQAYTGVQAAMTVPANTIVQVLP